MKKMMFLMLTFLIVGAASVNAQVRIGGTDVPDPSAVLDLGPKTGNANGGLALPRVELTDSTQKLNGVEPQPGTVVYNTGSAKLAAGAYVWTPVAGGGNVAFDGISTENTTTVSLAGNGKAGSNLKATVINAGIDSVQIHANAVRTTHIKNGAVTAAKIYATPADSGRVLMVNSSSGVPVWRNPGNLVTANVSADKFSGESITVSTKSIRQVYTVNIDTTLMYGQAIDRNTGITEASSAGKDGFCQSNQSAYYQVGFLNGSFRIIRIAAIGNTLAKVGRITCWEVY